MNIKRKKTRVVTVGKVKIGGNNPVIIQGMTKSLTEDVKSTIEEINSLEEAGCQLVRIALRTEEAASKIKKIKDKINIPLIADIHFDYRLALRAIDEGIDKVRINPGNINKEEKLQDIIQKAKQAKIPIRIGLNSGSVPFKSKSRKFTEDLVDYALRYIKMFEDNEFYDIIMSIKTSEVISTIKANELLSERMNYPIHIGVTATGLSDTGLVKSSIGIGTLLTEGIGDTIRVSLTSSSIKEIEVAKQILQSLEIKRFVPEIISCPTCGRCQVDLLKIAKQIKEEIDKMAQKYKKLNFLKIAVMGCEVNGPGEARAADIGVACGKDRASLFKKGKVIRTIKAKNIKKELLEEISNEMV